jgi:hypothetical protein
MSCFKTLGTIDLIRLLTKSCLTFDKVILTSCKDKPLARNNYAPIED